MALVTKMNRCAVCGSSQISLMADGKYYHCEARGHLQPHDARRRSGQGRSHLPHGRQHGGDRDPASSVSPSGSHHLDQGESGTAVTLYFTLWSGMSYLLTAK